MQQTKTLTIVVPSYNMEGYLPQCLDSMLLEDRLKDSLEVLVVNDGSKDDTLGIAKRYADKYPSIVRVIDKENGNYGSCVNIGLRKATGKYIKIVDADDSVDKSNFASFVDYLSQTDADLVLSDFVVVDGEGEVTKQVPYDFPMNEIFRMDSVCTTPQFLGMEMHAVAYKTERLREIGYTQTEGISYTDQQWIFIPMTAMHTVACFRKPVYRYLVGREGQTMNADVKLRSLSHLAQCSLDMASAFTDYDHNNKQIDRYLQHRLALIMKEVYATHLINYNQAHKRDLCRFDAELKRRSTSVYDMIGSKEVNSFMGLRYIDFWRKHQECPLFIIRLFSQMYVVVLKLKQSLHG